jgi:tetratricopeptide (TPR) repeat protein
MAHEPTAERFPPATLERLGRALHSLDAVEEAVKLLHRARRLRPDDFLVNFVLAEVLSELKPPQYYEEAVRYYTAASALRPDSPAVYYNSGFLLQTLGDNDGASTCYDQAIEADPGFHLAYNNRGLLWYGRKEYDRAIADYSEAHRLDPKFAIALYNRGNARYAKKQYDKAVADYAESIRLDPKYADAYNSLAWVLATCPMERFRDGLKAVEYATKACESSHYQNLYHLDTLAAAYAEDRQFDQAVQTEDRAIALLTGVQGALLTGVQGQDLRAELQRRRQEYALKEPHHEEPK